MPNFRHEYFCKRLYIRKIDIFLACFFLMREVAIGNNF